MVDYPPEMSRAPREPGPREVKYVHKASVYLRAAVAVGVVLLAYCVVLNTWTTALIRHGQVQNHSTLTNTASAARDAQVTAEAIHSCVTPGQPCFKRAQSRTAGAVASINQVVILASACGAGLSPTLSDDERRVQLKSCIVDQLAERKH